MKKVKTVEVKIFLGLKKGYTESYKSIQQLYNFLRIYCTKYKLAVSITPTRYIYVNGEEDGAIIGLINYPRFPSNKKKIKKRALHLAEELMYEFKQYRVSVMLNDKTYMLENDKLKNDSM